MKLQVAYVGICGSDIQRLDMGQDILSLGHEIVGEARGEFYAINPLLSCGNCEYCRIHQTRFCKSLISIGKEGTGGFAGGEIDVPQQNLVRLEKGESVHVLTDPVACVIHAVSLLETTPLKTVLIIGDGTMALICAELLIQQGVTVVQAIKNESRRSRAHQGAGIILYESLEMDQYDSVIVCAGGTRADILNKAASVVKASGDIIVIGAYHYLEDSLDIKTLLKKEIALKGSFSYEPFDFVKAASLISDNVDFFKTAISKEFDSSDITRALQYHRTNNDRRKVVVSFN